MHNYFTHLFKYILASIFWFWFQQKWFLNDHVLLHWIFQGAFDIKSNKKKSCRCLKLERVIYPDILEWTIRVFLFILNKSYSFFHFLLVLVWDKELLYHLLYHHEFRFVLNDYIYIMYYIITTERKWMKKEFKKY